MTEIIGILFYYLGNKTKKIGKLVLVQIVGLFGVGGVSALHWM